MKMRKMQVFLAVVLLGSFMPMQMSAQGKLQMWWRSTYFTDYFPQWVQSFIPRARVRQMFYGVESYYGKLRKLCCNPVEMNKLVDDYNTWMQQYKDIINEKTFLSGLSIVTGNPDSVLGLWKMIFGSIYESAGKDEWVHGVLSPRSKEAGYLLREIKKIIKNLEKMGAKVSPSEEAMLASISVLEAKF